MKLLKALLENILGEEQCGGTTMWVTITMSSATHCSSVCRYSTCGAGETSIKFNPPLPLAEALLHAAKYTVKGSFEHKETLGITS